MAIYKSSFNKNSNKQKAPKSEKKQQPKEQSLTAKPKRHVNKPLVSFLVFLALFIISVIPNNIFKNIILGLFGLSVYPVCLLGMVFAILFLNKRKLKAKTKYIVYLVCTLCTVWFIFHLILASKLPLSSYGEYLKQTYLAKTTAGGLLFSLISYPVVKLLTVVGAYIVSAIILAIFVGLIIDYINVDKEFGHKDKKSKFNFKEIREFETPEQEPQENITEQEKAKHLAKQKLGLEKTESTIISSNMPTYNVNNRVSQARPMSKKEYILTPIEPVIPTEDSEDLFLDDNTGYYNSKKLNQPHELSSVEEIKPVSEMLKEDLDTKSDAKPSEIELKNEPKTDNTAPKSTEFKSIFDDLATDNSFDELFVEESESEQYEEMPQSSEEYEDEYQDTPFEMPNYEQNLTDLNPTYKEQPTDYNQVEEVDVEQEYVEPIQARTEELCSTVETEIVKPSLDLSKFNLPNVVKHDVVDEDKQQKLDVKKEKQEIPPYIAPPVELLNYLENPYHISDEELQDNIDRLEQVLEDFKVPAKVNNVQVGPAVTRYELTMPRGISVNKIAQMSDDIAMTLASNGAIRVEAPIPGKNAVGIEVPNAQVSPVSLRELIDSNDFKVRANPLSFVLGKDINGDIIFCNLDKMPHVLVAGSTGSGKSVCLNVMLLSMCYKAGPDDLRLILVDPKMVEFSQYNGLPHLLIPEVITNKNMTINALDWSIKEMERRYALFAKNHVVNINEFNKLDVVKNKVEEKLPFIVIVVDELADLMLEAKREIEDRIAKLAAKARAAGIHLVLATQRPSVDVITGTVKANLPSRIAFALTNYMDSKTVLDGGGAEKLLGKGDMLFKPQDKPEPRRIQGAYVSNTEINRIVEFIKEKNKPVYDEDAGSQIKNTKQDSPNSAGDGAQGREQDFDPVLKDALKMFISTKQASGSMISRRFSVGFNRAGRIMDQMEMAGFIGPQEGSKPRQVLITMDEYRAIFGDE